MHKRPSVWSIVWTDDLCYKISPAIVAVLFFGLMVGFTGTLPGGRHKPDVPVSPEVAAAIVAGSVVLTLLLMWPVALRVASIRRLFEHDRRSEALLRQVKRFRGGETLKLEVELPRRGGVQKASYTLRRWASTPTFVEGTRIAVLLDPEHPKRAIPVALYGRTEAC